MRTERDLTCIVCPRGCALHVVLEDGKPTEITGYTCPRGRAYAETECTHPTRTLCSTVRCEDGRVIPVKTTAPIPKEKLFEAMAALNVLTVPAGTRAGEVVLPHIVGSDADLVTTDD